MLEHLITFGGWPILGAHKGGNWDEESYNFEDLMLKTMFYKVTVILVSEIENAFHFGVLN